MIQCRFKEWVWTSCWILSLHSYSSRKAERGPDAYQYISCTWMLMCLPTQCLKDFRHWQIVPQELRGSCDCKMNWNLPGGHNVSSNMTCPIISSGQCDVGCCSKNWASQTALTLSFPLVRHFILWGLSIFTSSHCKAAGPKVSAGRTSLHLLPFCLKDLFGVVLRYLDIFEESWMDFSQVMPKGIVSKQVGLRLFYSMGKTFPSVLHTT